jgi:hypothetical protein
VDEFIAAALDQRAVLTRTTVSKIFGGHACACLPALSLPACLRSSRSFCMSVFIWLSACACLLFRVYVLCSSAGRPACPFSGAACSLAPDGCGHHAGLGSRLTALPPPPARSAAELDRDGDGYLRIEDLSHALVDAKIDVGPSCLRAMMEEAGALNKNGLIGAGSFMVRHACMPA